VIHCRCGSICQVDSPISEQLKTMIRRLIDECWNQGDLDALDALYSAD
jgi:hypothetical protein